MGKGAARKSGVQRSARADAAKSLTHPEDAALADELMQELRALRMQISREIKRPPFVVFSDATLREMAKKRPLTLDELQQISGVGSVKRQRYGERFINVIAKHSGFDGTHRRMAMRAAGELLLAHRQEWLRGFSPEQAQDAFDYVMRLLDS